MSNLIPEEILDLIYQLPVACLLLLVVWKFLKFIKETQKDWLDTTRHRDDQFLAEIRLHQDRLYECQTAAAQALQQNAVVLDKVVTVMGKVDDKLSREAFERRN